MGRWPRRLFALCLLALLFGLAAQGQTAPRSFSIPPFNVYRAKLLGRLSWLVTAAEYRQVAAAVGGKLGPNPTLVEFQSGSLGGVYLASPAPDRSLCGARGNCPMAVVTRGGQVALWFRGTGLALVAGSGAWEALATVSHLRGPRDALTWYRYSNGRYTAWQPPGRPSQCGADRASGLPPCRSIARLIWITARHDGPPGLRSTFSAAFVHGTCPARRNCPIEVTGGAGPLLRVRGWAAAETTSDPPRLILARWQPGGQLAFTRYEVSGPGQPSLGGQSMPGDRLLPDACEIAAPGRAARPDIWEPDQYRLRPAICFPLPSSASRFPAGLLVDTTPLVNRVEQNGAGEVFGTGRSGRLVLWRHGRWTAVRPPSGAANGWLIPAPAGIVAVHWGSVRGRHHWLALYRGPQATEILPLAKGGPNGPPAIAFVLPSPAAMDVLTGGSPLFYAATCHMPRGDAGMGIYRLDPTGRLTALYHLRLGQFGSGPCGQAWLPPKLVRTPRVLRLGPGHYWLWGAGQGRWHPAFRGILDANRGRFTYHATLPGLPGPPNGIYRWDRDHVAVSVHGFGLYLVNIHSLAVRRVAGPPGRFRFVQAVASGGHGASGVRYVLTSQHSCRRRACWSQSLWRLWQNHWCLVATSLGPRAQPLFVTDDGVWLNASPFIGLRWLQPRLRNPSCAALRTRIISWRQGLPLRRAYKVFRLPAGKIFVSQGSRSTAFAPVRLRLHARGAFRPLGGDRWLLVLPSAGRTIATASGAIWYLSSAGMLTRWTEEGVRWLTVTVPATLPIRRNIGSIDFDTLGRLWLLPNCRLGPSGYWNPATGAWTLFPNFDAAAERARPHLVHPRHDGIHMAYGPGGRIAFIGPCNYLTNFNGEDWRRGRQFSVDEGAAVRPVFNADGRPYVARTAPPALLPPPGCPTLVPNSVVRDRLGRIWWVAQDRLYEAGKRACRVILRGSAMQPFIDGRRIAAATLLPDGGEWVATASPGAAILLPAALLAHPVATYHLPGGGLEPTPARPRAGGARG